MADQWTGAPMCGPFFKEGEDGGDEVGPFGGVIWVVWFEGWENVEAGSVGHDDFRGRYDPVMFEECVLPFLMCRWSDGLSVDFGGWREIIC